MGTLQQLGAVCAKGEFRFALGYGDSPGAGPIKPRNLFSKYPRPQGQALAALGGPAALIGAFGAVNCMDLTVVLQTGKEVLFHKF